MFSPAIILAAVSGLMILAAINHTPSQAIESGSPVVVAEVSPAAGTADGGTRVTITGQGFALEMASVDAGLKTTCGISFGQVYCWGDNSNGQLGDGTTTDSSIPIKVLTKGDDGGAASAIPADAVMTSVSVGYGAEYAESVCALSAAGQVYCWGNNDYGQLGNNSYAASPLPVKVLTAADGREGKGSEVPVGVTFKTISTGDSYSCAVGSNDLAYCWGKGDSGELGNGDIAKNSNQKIKQPVPVKVVTAAEQKKNEIPADAKFSIIVASEHATTCAIASGSAYCWGNNVYGQLGNKKTEGHAALPVGVSTRANDAGSAVPADATFTQINAGEGTVCAIISTGDAFCWGKGDSGELGNKTTAEKSLLPVKVFTEADDTDSDVPAAANFKSIQSSARTTCAVTEEDKLYCWGDGSDGALGNQSTENSTVPTEVAPPNLNTRSRLVFARSVQVEYDAAAGGARHSCAVTKDKDAYCWGTNDVGQLGNDSIDLGYADVPVPVASPPLSVSVGGAPCVDVDVLDSTTITCTTTAHEVGNADVNIALGTLSGQLASGYQYLSAEAPSITSITPNRGPATGGTDITITGTDFAVSGSLPVKVATGFNSSCALMSDSTIYCWGDNSRGQLGDGTQTASLTPVKVRAESGDALYGKTIIDLSVSGASASSANACALTSEGKAYCWGDNQFGQLGNGTYGGTPAFSALPSPVIDGAAADKTYKQITVGNYHVCALSTEGKVYCWGDTYYGQTGTGPSGSSRYRPTPVEVQNGPGDALYGKEVINISAGARHNCALTSDGEMYCWGWNSSGQTGSNTPASGSVFVPTAIYQNGLLAGKTVIDIGSSGTHSCATDSDGKTYCWGSDSYGKLGIGVLPSPANSNSEDTIIPGMIVMNGALSGRTVKSLMTSSATQHTCVVASDGGAYCWGFNTSGQLGNGLTATSTVPVAVRANAGDQLFGKSIQQIATGNNYTCAVASDNQVYCWGLNSSGQLGDGTNINALLPTLTDLPMSINNPTVTIGGADCTDVQLVNSTTITCKTSANTAGVVDVVVTNGDGQVSKLTDGYEYIEPAITAINPDNGETTGGTTVTITGAGFTYVNEVLFDTIACTSLNIISDTELTCITPAHAAGAVNVTVNDSFDQTATLASGFTYVPPWFIDLALSKTDIKLYPGIDEVAATDYLVANTNTNWLDGYVLSIEQGSDGSSFKCNANPAFALPTIATDHAANLDINSWGVGAGTSTDPPTEWRTISATPTTFGSSTAPGSFNDYIYFGARVNYTQKPCTYEGAVILTATMEP